MAARKTTTSAKRTADMSKAEMERNSSMKVRDMQRQQLELAETYKHEEKVDVSVSPFYAPHFGRNMLVSINGIPIYVPCNGKRYSIPKTYAAVVFARIRYVDEQLQRQNKMSDVQNNFERYVGEKQLIKRA